MPSGHSNSYVKLIMLILGALSIGVNPKIMNNNILNAYQTTQYDILWLSNPNIISK